MILGESNMEELKGKIMREAARTHKAAETAKDQGYYMSWQTLDTREKVLLEVLEWMKELNNHN